MDDEQEQPVEQQQEEELEDLGIHFEFSSEPKNHNGISLIDNHMITGYGKWKGGGAV